MAKKSAASSRQAVHGPNLFTNAGKRRRRVLFLPRFLAEEAGHARLRSKAQDHAHEILCKWADLLAKGYLRRKETALDADFLSEVFGEALGYKSVAQSPNKYQ